MTSEDLTELLRGLVHPDQPGSWTRLLEQIEGNGGMLAAARVAYDIGYGDGESSAWADFHTDNPDAVRLARELVAETDREGRR